MSAVSAAFSLRALAFSEIEGWQQDDPSAVLEGLEACLSYLSAGKPYRTGSLGLTSAELADFATDAMKLRGQSAEAVRDFFETTCIPFRIERHDGERGFVTAFFEPEVEVAQASDDVFRHPFYRRPDDLVDLDATNRPASLDPGYAFGRQTPQGITAYPDRQAIDEGFLAGRGLEIAYAKSKVEVFFTHVQGAARLIHRDGHVSRITYAAKAGHPFSAVGKLLIDRGEITREAMSMQAIRDWLIAHPEQMDEVLWHNRSYIFFREAPVEDETKGPIAAAKVPLIAGRSLAVDRLIHTFGFPFFIRAETLTHLDDGRPFARTMLALDTGSAIVGPARGDIFTGSGHAAGELAGTVRNPADFHIFIPRAAAARFLP